MFSFLSKQPILDADAAAWILQTYAWALRNYDARVFFTESVLVTPTNQHFPGRENSVEGMASLIFEQVRGFAGVKHWPCQLVNAVEFAEKGEEINPRPQISFAGPVRGNAALDRPPAVKSERFVIPFNPHQVIKPEALIADYAHIIAHYLGALGTELPPGGEENWPYATELLAIYMGFGIMFANSAYNYRGGCGSCYNPLAERKAYLSQDEATYALAIFCVLKNIPGKSVLPHLKSYLRPCFKRSMKELLANTTLLAQCRPELYYGEKAKQVLA